MSDYLKRREREKKLEKIRGKVSGTANVPKREKAQPKVSRLKLGQAWLYPLDAEPEAGAAPDSLARSVRLRWVAGFALVNDGIGGRNILGWIEYDNRNGDWWWSIPGQRVVGEKYQTLREAAADQSGLARVNATDKQWAALAQLEARVRKELD